jgi:CcmD family protein
MAADGGLFRETGEPDMDGGLGWVLAVNLVVWTGLFLYLVRLHRQLRALERSAGAGEETGR